MPSFARETLRDWFARHQPAGDGSRGRVMLWPDTFNNHFFPHTGKAAVEVLEAAGFEVMMPSASLCCGRPLYDYGMLDLARSFLASTVRELSRDLGAGTFIVALEPSCAAVFRDELPEMLPDDEDAVRLKRQTLLLSELLAARAPDWEAGSLSGRAIVQTHCHHKSVLGTADQQKILGRLGLQISEPEEGCCGMAGAFGFEREHRDVSLAIGERNLLPAVRDAASDTLILADGFSCREQIRQETGRHALHLAEVLHLASQRSGEPLGPFPESPYREPVKRWSPAAALALAAGGAALLAAAAARKGRKR